MRGGHGPLPDEPMDFIILMIVLIATMGLVSVIKIISGDDTSSGGNNKVSNPNPNEIKKDDIITKSSVFLENHPEFNDKKMKDLIEKYLNENKIKDVQDIIDVFLEKIKK